MQNATHWTLCETKLLCLRTERLELRRTTAFTLCPHRFCITTGFLVCNRRCCTKLTQFMMVCRSGTLKCLPILKCCLSNRCVITESLCLKYASTANMRCAGENRSMRTTYGITRWNGLAASRHPHPRATGVKLVDERWDILYKFLPHMCFKH